MGLIDFRAAASALVDRLRLANFAGITFGGHRDLYQLLGYKRVLTFFDFYDRYMRDGLAKTIVETYPEATWRGGVEVFEDESPDVDTAFEKAFKELDARLGFFQRCQQVDIAAGLSTFAVLLLGAPGDVSAELPKNGQLLFIKPYFGGGGPAGNRQARSNGLMAAASVARYETDVENERFGEPVSYFIRPSDLPGVPGFNREVHWSRVIHIAEGTLEDDIFGIPRLQCVFNLFDDLAKLTGGGAEAFWLRANQGLHLDIDKDMGLAVAAGQAPNPVGLSPADVAALRDKAEEMQHQLQRVLVTRGVTATQLGSDVAQFGPSADALLKQIAGAAKIPMRILTGSEMGTLASEQDAANFDSRVQDRRTGYAGPKIVRRIVDRLIAYGYLPTPKQYVVGWPVEEEMTEAEKAKYAGDLAGVNKTYGTTVITDDEIRDKAFKLKPLPDSQTFENLTEEMKASIASKLAMTNKEQGITVFTDDEIRKICYGFAPLSDAEKVPIGAPERISVTAPPKIGEDGLPIANPGEQVPVAQPLKTMLAALESAIEDDDLDAIGEILALGVKA